MQIRITKKISYIGVIVNVNWNPWHGCKKYSEGCRHCYVYRRDGSYALDASKVYKTMAFDLPIKKSKNGQYKYPSNTFFWTCFTSDFFLDEADEWRKEIWEMIKERSDCYFYFITKRINRFYESLPSDWGSGYNHVTICCTMENQKRTNERLPIFHQLPIKYKEIICEPLLENIEQITVGGESGNHARICNYDWVLNIRNQCIENKISFHFKQTGAVFEMNNKVYKIPRKWQINQAKKANIDVIFSDK